MRLFFWIGLVVLYCVPTQAQKGWYVEGSLHFGRAFKHRSTITIDFPDWSYGAEINLERQTYGSKSWNERCGFPRWGIALAYHYTGNAQQMGHGIAILPNVTIDFVRKEHWRIFGRLGVGLGIITKPYDRRSNPLNNMVGSYLNNNTSLRLGMAIDLHPQWELRPSATFTHYSNAASTLPNLGINIPSFQLGLCYRPNPVTKEDYIYAAEKPTRNKRIQFSALVTGGLREIATSNGPKYPVWQTSVDAGLFLSPNNRLKMGMEYDYLAAFYAFNKHNGSSSKEDLHWQASRLTLFLADEIFIGRLSINAQVGVYLTQNKNQLSPISFRLAARYYLLDPYQNTPAPFLIATMKAHRIIAEYFSVGAGIAF
ncbi:MAG: acyloxyacyl hydrolase [Aureispira sp.]